MKFKFNKDEISGVPSFIGDGLGWFEAFRDKISFVANEIGGTVIERKNHRSVGHSLRSLVLYDHNGHYVHGLQDVWNCEGPGYRCSYSHGPWYPKGFEFDQFESPWIIFGNIIYWDFIFWGLDNMNEWDPPFTSRGMFQRMEYVADVNGLVYRYEKEHRGTWNLFYKERAEILHKNGEPILSISVEHQDDCNNGTSCIRCRNFQEVHPKFGKRGVRIVVPPDDTAVTNFLSGMIGVNCWG